MWLIFPNIKGLCLISLLIQQPQEINWLYLDNNSFANRTCPTICDLNRKSKPVHMVFHPVNMTFQNVNGNNMGKFLL